MTDEASAKAAGKDDEADGVHRLRDIVVEEVSLVDRAANKRRFLVVKRSADMADENTATADTEPDSPKALEKAKKKPAEAATEDAADQEKAKKKPADEDEAGETEKARASTKDDDDDEDSEDEPTRKARKQDLVLAPPVKEALLRVLTDALERLMTLANTIKEAAEPEDGGGGEMPEDVGAELEAIADLLWDAKKSKRTKADVAKAGARMAKDRLDRFQKAMALLAEILKELTDGKEPMPTAGAAEAGVRKRDGAPAPAAVPGMADLIAGITELTRVVKRQEEELGRIRQARGVSNAIPVDGARRREPEEVFWPFDMNRPITRDKVRKEVSFFDDETR